MVVSSAPSTAAKQLLRLLPLLGDHRREKTGGGALGCHHSTANWWQGTQHRELVGASFHKTCNATAGKLTDEGFTETIKACGLPAQTPSPGMIRCAEIKIQIHASWWVCLLSICRKETGTFRTEGEPSAVMSCLQSHGLASPQRIESQVYHRDHTHAWKTCRCNV